MEVDTKFSISDDGLRCKDKYTNRSVGAARKEKVHERWEEDVPLRIKRRQVDTMEEVAVERRVETYGADGTPTTEIWTLENGKLSKAGASATSLAQEVRMLRQSFDECCQQHHQHSTGQQSAFPSFRPFKKRHGTCTKSDTGLSAVGDGLRGLEQKFDDFVEGQGHNRHFTAQADAKYKKKAAVAEEPGLTEAILATAGWSLFALLLALVVYSVL